ncbi:putative integral membrane protein [Theileria parva strain Muguga]|uniref:Uncharacterized protein n=1 Tax=Theileria parva TaxID=5875 RepID=Q4N571_THEPA|nr:putative integral membrane protein [Theileria parva strain Muguga]EAN32702.1 putative integral membrane protein [Theileria parva strain Muguga]|eukprot:XP_764985.1 hypothetical protein [Theileria parva strain Muguga]
MVVLGVFSSFIVSFPVPNELMTDSSGLYNDPEKVESYKRFYWSSVVWLLLGAITTFGVIMYSFSPRVYFNLLEAQARNPGELQSKLVMYSVLISGIGVLIGGIFLPLNLTAIVISLVIALVTAFAVVVFVFLRSSKDLFYSFFASQISCLALGIVDLIGTVSVNDKFIPGNPTYRMLLFHIGKPIGYLLVLAIIFVLEFQSFGHSLTHSLAHSLAHSLGDNPIGVNSSVDNLIGDNLIGDNLIVSSFPVESNVLMTYQIIVMNLLAVPILIVMINYCMKSDENQRKWRSTNLINAGKTLAKTLYTYLCLEEFDHTLLIVECSEGFFNSAIRILIQFYPFTPN